MSKKIDNKVKIVFNKWWVKISSFIILLILFNYINHNFLLEFYTNIFFYKIVEFFALLGISFIIAYLANPSDIFSFGIRWDKFSMDYLIKGAILPLAYFSFLFIIYLFLDDFVVNSINYQGMFWFIFGIFAAATGEELLFRGIIYQSLIERFNPVVITLIISLLFSFVHAMNPNVELFDLINVFLAGIVISLMYLKTLSLWMPISFHFVWNVSQHIFLGSPISGIDFNQEVLEFDVFYDGKWYNMFIGNEFGIEGSIFTSLFLLFYIIYLLKYVKTSPYQSALNFRNKYLISKLNDE